MEEQEQEERMGSTNGFAAYVPPQSDEDECDDECCCGHDHVHHHDHERECGHDHARHHHDHECECGHDPDHECCGRHHHGDEEDEVLPPYPGDAGPFVFIEDEPEKPAPAWREPAFSEFDFEHDGLRYHVRRWGDAKDIPLVLLHGFMQSGDGWWVVAPHLAQDHCVYAFDLIGHGLSDKPVDTQAYTIAHEADAVAAFLTEMVEPAAAAADTAPDAEGKRHRAHLLGYSMGGRVALEVALMQGDLLYSLILESAGLGPADEGERAESSERESAWADQLREGDIESFVAQWEQLPLFATQQRLSVSVAQAVRAERLANDPQALACALDGMGQHTMRSRDENLAMLDCVWMPVLYLAGTRDEKYRAIAEGMIKQGFDANSLMGGHNTHLEAPEYFLDAVGDFFTRIEVRNR